MTKPNPGDPMTTLPPFAMSRAVNSAHVIQTKPEILAPDRMGSMHRNFGKARKALTICLLLAGAVGIVQVLLLCALGLSPELAECGFSGEAEGGGALVTWLLGGFAFAVALSRLGWRAGLRDPLRAAVPVLLLAPVAVYLAQDEMPDLRRLSAAALAELRPADGADQAWMRRWGGRWFADDRDMRSDYHSPKAPGLDGIDPKSPDAAARIVGARTELSAVWAELAPVRAWWAELAKRPAPGSYRVNGKPVLVPWGPMRDFTKYGFLQARLLALDGRGDAALELLGEIVSGASKLEVGAGDLGRIVTCRRIVATGLQVAGQVLEDAGNTISGEARGRLAINLAEGAGGSTGFRRAVALEALLNAGVYSGMEETGGVVRLIFNPQATANVMDGHLERVMEAGAQRDFAAIRRINRDFAIEARNLRGPKNVGFWRGFAQNWPEGAFQKMGREYWALEDRRAELITQLREGGEK